MSSLGSFVPFPLPLPMLIIFTKSSSQSLSQLLYLCRCLPTLQPVASSPQFVSITFCPHWLLQYYHFLSPVDCLWAPNPGNNSAMINKATCLLDLFRCLPAVVQNVISLPLSHSDQHEEDEEVREGVHGPEGAGVATGGPHREDWGEGEGIISSWL